MLRQIKLLTWLRLVNFFGLNEARFSREKKKKARLVGMLALYAVLGIVLLGYVALLCIGIAELGAGDRIPLCIGVVSSLVVLTFTTLKAGPALFDLQDYEALVALPLRPAAVIISRFLSMYISNAGMTLAVLLPGMIVCGVVLKPGFLFYPILLLGGLLLPLIPMTIAMLLGMLVYMASLRMKRRSLAVLFFTALATIAVMVLPVLLSSMQPDRLILSVRSLLDRLRGFYPPAGWFGDAAVNEDVLLLLGFGAASIAFFGAAAALVGWKYPSICSRLASVRSRRDFRMMAQRSKGVLTALYRRELRRYLASPIYVMNTAVGYVLALLFSGSLIFTGIGSIFEIPIPLELVPRMIPFLLAFCYCISPSTANSISLEGKQWPLTKSLPVSAKALVQAKLLMNLSMALPVWLVSTVLLMIAVQPTLRTGLWLALLPLGYILFSAALGLRINLAFPAFEWENEAVPVKQGKSTLFTMLIGMAASILPAVALALLPTGMRDVFSGLLAVVLLASAALLCRSCMRVKLEKIN